MQANFNQTVVIALDLNVNNLNYREYLSLPPEKQIEVLKISVYEAYAQVTDLHPINNTNFIIAWREYGVTAYSDNRRALSCSERELFINTMTELSELPNLTIIAGTIASFKNKNSDDIQNIRGRYQKNKYMANHEKKELISQEYTRHSQDVNRMENNEFTQIRNTCYIFSNGEKIEKRDKSVPFEEKFPSNRIDMFPKPVFKPGINLEPVNINGTKILIQICREHGFPVSKSAVEADLQLIISDSINLYPDKIHAKNCIHIDSYEPMALLTNSDNNENPIKMYKMDALNKYKAPKLMEVISSPIQNSSDNCTIL